MNVAELRIGNYINFLDIKREVKAILNIANRKDVYWIVLNDFVGSKTIHLKPILLTEEWLVKFGFENYNYINGLKGFEEVATGYVLNELLLTYFDANKSLTGEGYFCSSKNEKNIINKFPLKYVHQLQNLIFAMTQEELKYKD